MSKQVDTQKYTEFVDAVTSKESNDYISFNSRCFEIQKDPKIIRFLILEAYFVFS